ncbi:MAG: CocE/NonD family hydrolase [Chitinophagaceae bacterium]
MPLRYGFPFLLLLLSYSSLAQVKNQDSIWVVNNYHKEERMITMRDGVKLYTVVYIPNDTTESHPILLKRTPYSCAPYGPKEFTKFWEGYHMTYCKEKYIIVSQDVRGRFMSEGDFVDVRPFNPNKKNTSDIDEASDTYDAIDWLVKNVPFNNGKVGVFGISYPGFYSTMAALSGHPALKAVSPQAPVTDWFIGDDFHHGGALMLIDAFQFYSAFGVPRPKPTMKYNSGYSRTEPDAYKYYLAAGPLPNLTKLMGDSIVFWNDLMTHPNYDGWWKARNPRNFVKDIKPAILTVGGLFDAEDCFGAWNLYKAIEKANPATAFNKLVMGPWFHGAWEGRADGTNLGKVKFGSKTSAWYQQNIELPFFNYFLKNEGSIDKIKEANIFFSGENNWKNFEQWPPKEVVYKPIYLQSNKGLSFWHPRPLGYHEMPDTSFSWSSYISDPANPVPNEGDTIKRRTREYMTADQRFAAQRSDVLVFSSDTLKENITLAGPLVADLMVSISGTDADFVVKLIDVFPNDIADSAHAFKYTNANIADTIYRSDTSMNGYQMLVRGEVLRGKYRNSFEKPEPFVANKITRVKVTMPDVAHTFLKGHRMMVQIQSSWFPLTDINPQKFVDIYHAKPEDFQPANIRIYHTEGLASKLILPVLKP